MQGQGINYPSPGYGYKAFHHLLLNNDFEIIEMLKDPALALVMGGIIERLVGGQSLIQKMVMGNSFKTMATRDGDYAFDTTPGTPTIVDATVTLKQLTSRFQIDGTTIDELKSTPAQAQAIRLADFKRMYLEMFIKTQRRILAGDGSGRLCYTGASSVAAMAVVDDDGSTAMAKSHPAWPRLFPGIHVDVVNASTGLAVEGGVDRIVQSISLSGSTVTLDEAVTVTGSKAYYLRLHTPHSDTTDPDYTAAKATQPEPNGLGGIITSDASYLGYSGDSYADWNSSVKDLGGASPTLEYFDEIVAFMNGIDGIVAIGDSAVITQLRLEANAKGMLRMETNQSIYMGVPDIKYQTMVLNSGPIPLLSSPEFNGSRKIFLVAPKSLALVGSTIKPTWKRGTLAQSEAYNYVFDDMEMRYEMYTGQRKKHGLLTNCGAAYGWNQVTR